MLVLTGVLAVACTGQRSSSPPTADRQATPSVHLALGDSVAAGLGAQDPVVGGYAPLLTGLLEARLGCTDDPRAVGCPVTLRNLAVGGATTGSLLRDQLPQALDVLAQDTRVQAVTVTIGGNDVFAAVVGACAADTSQPSCGTAILAALQRADAGISQVLSEVKAAVPPGTPVAVMTYYNPLEACRLAPLQPLAELVLEGSDEAPGLNDSLRRRAKEHSAVVVETVDLLRTPEDFVGGGDCLHPSGSGHERIARAFADALGPPAG